MDCKKNIYYEGLHGAFEDLKLLNRKKIYLLTTTYRQKATGYLSGFQKKVVMKLSSKKLSSKYIFPQNTFKRNVFQEKTFMKKCL